MTHADILATVDRMIREVMGEDYVYEDEITMATTFNADLELESIEMVQLAEKLQAHYGEGINFAAWMGQMELDEIINLTVGDLVEYVESCRTS
ncbi:MAG: acyl carrier protein [Bacteroidota bacterium]